MNSEKIKNMMFEAEIKALKEVPLGGLSTVCCPVCGTKIEVIKRGTANIIQCQTDNCLADISHEI